MGSATVRKHLEELGKSIQLPFSTYQDRRVYPGPRGKWIFMLSHLIGLKQSIETLGVLARWCLRKHRSGGMEHVITN